MNLPCKCRHPWEGHIATWEEVFGSGLSAAGPKLNGVYLNKGCSQCTCGTYEEMTNLEYCEYVAKGGPNAIN